MEGHKCIMKDNGSKSLQKNGLYCGLKCQFCNSILYEKTNRYCLPITLKHNEWEFFWFVIIIRGWGNHYFGRNSNTICYLTRMKATDKLHGTGILRNKNSKQWRNLREDSGVKGTNEPAVPAVLFLSDMRWLGLKGSSNPWTHSVLDEKSLSTPFILSQNVKKKRESSVKLLCVCNGSIQSIVFHKPPFLYAMWSYRLALCFHAW